MQDHPTEEAMSLFNFSEDTTRATLSPSSMDDTPTRATSSRGSAARLSPVRSDADRHPLQMSLQVGPTGRTVTRHVLIHCGLTEALLCRMEVVGLLLPIAGTQGRQYDAEDVAAMWRAVALARRRAAASVSDIERVVREQEASRG